MSVIGRLLAAFEEGFFPGRRVRRQLREKPQVQLSTLPENTFARVTGIVRSFEHRLLEAPLSRRLCVYYDARVIADSGSRRITDYEEIGRERAGIAFLLDDATARAVVAPDRARVSLPYDFESTSLAAFDASTSQRAMLDRLNLVHRDWFTTTSLLYRETVIEEGDVVSIFGAGVYETEPEGISQGTYRDGPPQRLRFTGSRRFPLLIGSDPTKLR